MTFSLNIQRFLLILLFGSIIIISKKLDRTKFDLVKSKLAENINSMRLGNYLRKLMMKNNDLIDDEFVFLDDDDFSISNDELNYSTLHLKEDDHDLRARLFAYKWSKTNTEKKMKPLTVSKGKEDMDKKWQNYLVLLMGPNEENEIKKVCFPNDLKDNFAIVTNMNSNCSPKITKIKEYNIMDNNEDKQLPDQNEKIEQPHHKKKKTMEEKFDNIIENLKGKQKRKKTISKRTSKKSKGKKHEEKKKIVMATENETSNHNNEKESKEKVLENEDTQKKSSLEEIHQEKLNELNPHATNSKISTLDTDDLK